MAEPQLSVRSARARALAHRLARRERRSIAQVVERALELYSKSGPQAEAETAQQFWDRVAHDYATDIDLAAVIDEIRKPQREIDL